jgi:carboxyl-terminal processing protease
MLLLAVVCLFNVATFSASAFTEEQKLIAEVWRIVNRAYLDETFNHQNWWFTRQRFLRKSFRDREDTYSAIQDMLASLEDPYTRLLKPNQYRTLQTSTSGELTGVGLQISQDEAGYLRVIAPIEGSPADAAGMLPRDRVLKINGMPTLDLTLDEAADRMRGKVGTIVTLTVERGDQAPFDVNLKRDHIVLNPVYADVRSLADGTQLGYLRLNQFNANAAEEMTATVNEMEDQGVDAYILDLRNNPGGLLQAGIEIAQLWLNDEPIVYTVNRQGIIGSFAANGQALTADPLVVLVNGGTASASEILAGALQDNGRAELVGEVTFGKGLIQSLFDLSDGSGLAVTIAKYETPSHKDINKHGIQPDHVVPIDMLTRSQFATEQDPQYEAAVDLLMHSSMLAHA